MKSLITALSFLMFLITLLLTTSCNSGYEECHDSLYIENKTASTIYYVTTLKDGFLNFDPTTEQYAVDFMIHANETKKVKIGMKGLSCWEQVLESANGYVYIYIYDAKTLEAQGWENTKNKPIKKYTLSAKDLSNMNWKISYS